MPIHANFNGRRSLGIASVLEIPPQRAHHLIRADRRFFYVKPPLPTGRLEIYTNRDFVEALNIADPKLRRRSSGKRPEAFKELKNMSPDLALGLLGSNNKSERTLTQCHEKRPAVPIFEIWIAGSRPVSTISVSIARIPHPDLPNHSPQPIRFTALDHLQGCRTFESRVRDIEPRTNL